MVLNPDVVVRSLEELWRNVLCVSSMIQKTKLEAKKAGRQVADEAAQTACSLACDTGAMVFGDVMNKSHEVAELKDSSKSIPYVRAVKGTQPSVVYHTKVRNK